MRVLVLGAGGQVGAELVREARDAGHQVMATARADLDITDPAAVRQRVLGARADAVFNAAAYTAVDRAESETSLAMEVNANAPGTIAQAAAEAGSLMVHYSTDYVFDGTATAPIDEDAVPNPLGVYGRSKLAGEESVRAVGAASLVVRTGWVYGQGANFIRTVLRVTRELGEMRVVDDQRGSPTWARDIAAASLHLAELGATGTYHLTNGGDCTWYGLARTVMDVARVDAAVIPISTDEFPTPARRPAYSVLDNRCWREMGERPLRPWRDAVAEFLGSAA